MQLSEIPISFVVISFVVLFIILAFDIILAFRRPHVPSTRESINWVIFYITLALIFAGSLWWIVGSQAAAEFTAGWLTEYSLSIDNLFIFLLIMARFAVPKKQVQSMLMVGILAALVFRAIFIILGVHLIENFSWLFYIFALIIAYAALNQLFTGHKDEEKNEDRLITWLRKHLAITNNYSGSKLRVVQYGKMLFTPVILVYITLATTDVMFALDSIPAIFGITQSAFLIIAANIFALMGLRQLYFLLGTLVDKLVYLKYGIAAILLFIAVKLFATALHENQLPIINSGQAVMNTPEVSISVSLTVIIGILVLSIFASLVHSRIHKEKS